MFTCYTSLLFHVPPSITRQQTCRHTHYTSDQTKLHCSLSNIFNLKTKNKQATFVLGLFLHYKEIKDKPKFVVMTRLTTLMCNIYVTKKKKSRVYKHIYYIAKY